MYQIRHKMLSTCDSKIHPGNLWNLNVIVELEKKHFCLQITGPYCGENVRFDSGEVGSLHAGPRGQLCSPSTDSGQVTRCLIYIRDVRRHQPHLLLSGTSPSLLTDVEATETEVISYVDQDDKRVYTVTLQDGITVVLPKVGAPQQCTLRITPSAVSRCLDAEEEVSI